MHNTHEPMQNSREEKLRADLKKVLIHSRNYPDFERQITALGYQVIKGRGISFVDEKKVKIKGSEVGFSLATIEKILRQNSLNPSQKEQILQQQKQLDRKEKQDFEKDSRPFQGAEKQPEESLAGSLLDTLFESEETHSPVIDPWRLREEKRKRKSKGQRIN